MEARCAGEVSALVRQRRNDPGGRGLGEARLVRYGDDPGAFLFRQRVRRSGPDRVRPPVAPGQPIVLPPPLDRARVDPGQRTGLRLPGTTRASRGDLVDQGLAIFQAGHASSPSWKIAWS